MREQSLRATVRGHLVFSAKGSVMSIHTRVPRPLGRSRSRRRRSSQPILESLEYRVVLTIVNPPIQPTYALFQPAGAPIAGGQATPPSTAFGPVQLQSAYGIDNVTFGGSPGDGTGQTIAIVDAYDDPSLGRHRYRGFSTSDLAEFDAYYGLPDPPSFTKVNQSGRLPARCRRRIPPARGPENWEIEEALDIE